jgi:hypothetical protein
MQRALHKGVPPLFKELKTLYVNKDKIKIIESLCLSYIDNLNCKSVLNGLIIFSLPFSSLMFIVYLSLSYLRK